MKTFLLVSSSVTCKQLLCFVHGEGQNRDKKHTKKNFVEFHNHSALLTMLWTVSAVKISRSFSIRQIRATNSCILL